MPEFCGPYVYATLHEFKNNISQWTRMLEVGAYDGSDTAWFVRMQFGKEKFEKAGDWRAWIDYRYVGSDAVVDAFNDDDFGDGGTNMEGFSLGASVAISKRSSLGLRWFSANEITGPPLKSDILFFDFTTKF